MYSTPSEPNEPIPPAATTRWHGTNGARRLRAQNVPAARAAPGPPGERGELAVGDDLAARHRAERARAVAVEAVLELELDVGEVVRLAGEERREPSREDMAGGCPARSDRHAAGRGSSDQTTRSPSSQSLADARSPAPRSARASASPRVNVVPSRADAAPRA